MYLHRDLGRLEGKIDGIVTTLVGLGVEIRTNATKVERLDDKINENISDAHDRINRVERRQYWFSGAAAALGATFGAVLHKLGLAMTTGGP